MTKFEQKGVNHQCAAKTVDAANTEFDISCYACTHSPRALYCDCDSCAIRLVHEYIVAALQDAARKDGVA